MTKCPICEHAKIKAIDAALAARVAPSVIAGNVHVPKKLIELHAAHLPSATVVRRLTPVKYTRDEALQASLAPVGGIVGQGMAHTDDPWRQIRYHVLAAASVWRDLEHEARTVERLTFLLQEAFRDEEMGL